MLIYFYKLCDNLSIYNLEYLVINFHIYLYFLLMSQDHWDSPGFDLTILPTYLGLRHNSFANYLKYIYSVFLLLVSNNKVRWIQDNNITALL